MIEELWLLLAVLLVLGWYLTYTASRLDRLHAKVTAARTALDVQLLRRHMAAIEAGRYLDPASALLVTDAASRAMAAAEQDEELRGAELAARYRAEIASGQMVEAEVRFPLPDGSFRHAWVTSLPDLQEGTLRGHFTVISDITETRPLRAIRRRRAAENRFTRSGSARRSEATSKRGK